MTPFLKPDLTQLLSELPMPYRAMVMSDYENSNTREELTDLVHHWLTEGENSISPKGCYIYLTLAYTLYSMLTNKSYESNLNIESGGKEQYKITTDFSNTVFFILGTIKDAYNAMVNLSMFFNKQHSNFKIEKL